MGQVKAQYVLELETKIRFLTEKQIIDILEIHAAVDCDELKKQGIEALQEALLENVLDGTVYEGLLD
jgi:hypothetical protein